MRKFNLTVENNGKRTLNRSGGTWSTMGCEKESSHNSEIRLSGLDCNNDFSLCMSILDMTMGGRDCIQGIDFFNDGF